MAVQKLIKVNLISNPAEHAAHLITLDASKGHRYAGHARCVDRRGATQLRAPGVYVDDCLIWMDSAPAGSLFHGWRLARRRSGDLVGELNKVIEYENANGFNLVALIPLDALTEEVVGSGTVGYYALFERPAEVSGPLMLDRWTLEPKRPKTDQGVRCPVLGCDFVAPRMAESGPNLRSSSKDHLADYLCPRHRIYISPSTFEYEEPTTSLLWPRDKETARRLTSVGKRTWSRMGRENDEDSLTWNTFRYLERNDLLGELLGNLLRGSGLSLWRWGSPEKVVYWSMDLETMVTWDELGQARRQLGENASGSEPDIIIVFPTAVVLIEVKSGSNSVTKARSSIPSHYQDVNGVFKKDLQSTASVESIGYQLMRFFLLGEALREHFDKRLIVISVIREGQDSDLLRRVHQAVNLNTHRQYTQLTWEQIYKFIKQTRIDNPIEQMIMLRYLKGKTLGYNSSGVLQTLLDKVKPDRTPE